MKHGIIIGNFKYRYLELTQCSNQRTQVDEFAILYLINSKVLISVPVQLVDCWGGIVSAITSQSVYRFNWTKAADL